MQREVYFLSGDMVDGPIAASKIILWRREGWRSIYDGVSKKKKRCYADRDKGFGKYGGCGADTVPPVFGDFDPPVVGYNCGLVAGKSEFTGPMCEGLGVWHGIFYVEVNPESGVLRIDEEGGVTPFEPSRLELALVPAM